jgi:hypothetical protein
VSIVLLPRMNSERRLIRPELSELCKRSDLSLQLFFVYLFGVSVPNEH